MILDAKKKEKK